MNDMVMLGIFKILVVLFILIIGGTFTAYMIYNWSSWKKKEADYAGFITGLTSEAGYKDVSSDKELSERLEMKLLSEISVKCLWSGKNWKIDKIYENKQDNKTIYLVLLDIAIRETSNVGGRVVDMTRSGDVNPLILFIELPLNLNNTYLIRKKQAEEKKDYDGDSIIPPPPKVLMERMEKALDRKIRRKEEKKERYIPVSYIYDTCREHFEAFTLEGPEEGEFLDSSIQEFLVKNKDNYPFGDYMDKVVFAPVKVRGDGKIVITSGSVSIHGNETKMPQALGEFINLGIELADIVINK